MCHVCGYLAYTYHVYFTQIYIEIQGNSCQTPSGLFWRNWPVNSKIYMEIQRILKKENKAGGLYTWLYWHWSELEKQKRGESRNRPNLYCQLIVNQGAKSNQWKKESLFFIFWFFFTNSTEIVGYLYRKMTAISCVPNSNLK